MPRRPSGIYNYCASFRIKRRIMLRCLWGGIQTASFEIYFLVADGVGKRVDNTMSHERQERCGPCSSDKIKQQRGTSSTRTDRHTVRLSTSRFFTCNGAKNSERHDDESSSCCCAITSSYSTYSVRYQGSVSSVGRRGRWKRGRGHYPCLETPVLFEGANILRL